MSEEKKPEGGEPKKVSFHAISVDTALVMVLSDCLTRCTEEGSDGYNLVLKIDKLFEDQKIHAINGSLMLALIAMVNDMAKDSGRSRATVMASFVNVLMAHVVKSETVEKFSSN